MTAGPQLHPLDWSWVKPTLGSDQMHTVPPTRSIDWNADIGCKKVSTVACHCYIGGWTTCTHGMGLLHDFVKFSLHMETGSVADKFG